MEVFLIPPPFYLHYIPSYFVSTVDTRSRETRSNLEVGVNPP
ncbi:hypothetical protein [Leptolyngbya sp. FACHB-16]|nr:hypothetical protein [Leptolyngbya sp. FACHB-16]